MSIFPLDKKKIIIIDFVILLVCGLGVYNIINKAALPFKITSINSKLLITDVFDSASNFSNGDIIISIENYELKSNEEIEILLDGKNPNEELKIIVFRNNQLIEFQFITKFYYSTFYNAIASLVGVMFILVALIVLIKCDREMLARAFHWAFIFTAMIIMMTWGNYSLLPYHLGIATRIGFHIGYLFAPVLFLKFAILFPSHLNINTKNIFKILYVVSIILTLTLSVIFYLLVFNINLDWMRTYITAFDISSAYIILVNLSAIIVFVHTFITTTIETDKNKLRWILLGFILGPLSYLLLWVIPSRIWNHPLVPESLVLFLVAFVPVTFGISIVKHRLMNVDIIFKRSIVYFIVIATLLITYVLILTIIAKLLNNPDSEISSIVAAISIALLFEPAKVRIQKFVDKKFFRVEYNYRQALNSFFKEIKDIYSINTLCAKVIERVDNLIPLNKLGFLSFDNKLNLMTVIAHKNYDHILNKKITLEQNTFNSFSSIPIAVSNKIEPGVEVNKTPPKVFIEIGSDLVFVTKSPANIVYGFLVLGEKKSGLPFTAEDIDLLTIISSRISLTFDRIKLQEEIIREHLETERLEELNKLKLYFVSSVSHDLKTPITSIKMFAELLKSSNSISPEKKFEYLSIIEGESSRLTRFIDNVLDYSSIEKGIKKYNYKITEVNKVIKEVIKLMEYQFKIQKFLVETDYYKDDVYINADRDAIIEAVINLISNSIKFSTEIKSILISVNRDHNAAYINITDKGIGISREDMGKLYQPFYKSDKTKLLQNRGTGLGLSIVKHIMDAHKGKINIVSEVLKGTTVTLEFPLSEFHNQEIK